MQTSMPCFCWSVICPSIYTLFTIARTPFLVNSTFPSRVPSISHHGPEPSLLCLLLLLVAVRPWLSAPPVPHLLPVGLFVGRSQLCASHIHHLSLYGRTYSARALCRCAVCRWMKYAGSQYHCALCAALDVSSLSEGGVGTVPLLTSCLAPRCMLMHPSVAHCVILLF